MTAPWSVRGAVCVVTGASGGIGKEVARGLAREGARVVMVCRSKERGEAARGDILGTAPGAAVDLVVADLFLQGEVRRAAGQINAAYPEVKVLVNNAGLIIGRRRLTPEGREETFALNHLAYFLLTSLLLPKLQASAPARVICTASEAHRWAKWDWGNLEGEKRYREWRAYANSKLANVLFAKELARRLAGTGVTSNALHPGLVKSGFGKTGSAAVRLAMALGRPIEITPTEGARTTLWAATAPELAGVTGRYFSHLAEDEPSRAAQDEGLARELWALSERLTGLRPA